jgi:acyl carrier protein
MSTLTEVRDLLARCLQLGPRGLALDAHSPLIGAIPEFDSMAVVNVLTAIEEHFGISVADDEISASTFETLGTLSTFVDEKLATP